MSVDGNDTFEDILNFHNIVFIFHRYMDTYWNESNWLEFLKMFDISHWYV